MENLVKKHVVQQALVAILEEAERKGVLAEIEEQARAGIMGNRTYTWIANTDDKVAAVDLIADALAMVKR